MEVVPGTGSQRLNAARDAGISGHDDDDRIAIVLQRGPENIHPGRLGHVEIDKDDVELAALDCVESFFPRPISVTLYPSICRTLAQLSRRVRSSSTTRILMLALTSAGIASDRGRRSPGGVPVDDSRQRCSIPLHGSCDAPDPHAARVVLQLRRAVVLGHFACESRGPAGWVTHSIFSTTL